MFTDEELLPVSALQHFVYCRRRAALVYIEGLWGENRFTAEGRRLHGRVHDPRRGENRPGVRIARGLELCSYRHGLVGKADVVEFHVTIPGQPPKVRIVEYKRGRPKPGLDAPFHVQLCAQALCLEEMLGSSIESGTIFFGQAHRRVEVTLDAALRAQTLEAIAGLHALVHSRRTPTARFQAKCKRCSLLHLCLPGALRPRATAARYLLRATEPELPADESGPSANPPHRPPAEE